MFLKQCTVGRVVPISDKNPVSGEDISSCQSLHRDTPGGGALIEPTQGQVVEESIVQVSDITGFQAITRKVSNEWRH